MKHINYCKLLNLQSISKDYFYTFLLRFVPLVLVIADCIQPFVSTFSITYAKYMKLLQQSQELPACMMSQGRLEYLLLKIYVRRPSLPTSSPPVLYWGTPSRDVRGSVLKTACDTDSARILSIILQINSFDNETEYQQNKKNISATNSRSILLFHT